MSVRVRVRYPLGQGSLSFRILRLGFAILSSFFTNLVQYNGVVCRDHCSYNGILSVVRIPKTEKSLRKQFSLDTFGDYVKITEYIDAYTPFKILLVGTSINLQFFRNLRLNFNNWRSSKLETRHFVSLET